MAPVALDPLLQELGTQQTNSQPSQTAEIEASQPTEADKVGTKRSASYSESEDDGTTFWKRVHHSYSKNLPESCRTPGSLKAHWVALQKPISKFRGFVNQVEQFGESGALAEDCLNRALELFSKDQKVSFNKKNQLPVQKKRLRSPSSDAPASSALTSEPVSDAKASSTNTLSVQRPIGKKKAKLLHELAKREDSWKDIVARAHESVANESKRQNDIFNMEARSLDELAQNSKTNTQVSIMDKDLSNLDDDSKEYFRLKKKNY
ncbi:uncharacterized protein PGTG_22803 [Puccinia graminis f. sp. tritici CRL 75-36-700-3]|uniref:No apical meristem-associated C-terminal domain-containing protein n=1 Tax=Puccinia graminis f. sp. tritici (strain CRL 75-36-700-3 / race SCCL) TaxID=418459 RepID=H6QVN2_PUCGT|nr:uncharacterized protein PGTG_22803 [Puccinia graminis f. sp. tritici CRL 75-36-700-3]EHS63493.1 hypothetical protein PGTG_22803 [Puccinia graminis f. sp. tritici CRL 75-36-700-3]